VDSESRVWTAFVLLGLAWGSSFLFIKIALRTLEPLTLVGLRLMVGWVGLVAIAWWRGLALPRGWAVWRHLAILGAINTAIPFVLITWAESGANGVDSAVASVLNSTVPLFSIVIAGLIFRMEEVTPDRILGLLVGFAGVVLLLGRDLGNDWGELAPQVAVVVAALFYAIASTYARRNLHETSPVLIAAGQLLVADALVWIFAILIEDPGAQTLTWQTVGALLWLGLLGSCIAYILYFFILRNWGATRATMVTYLLPVVGVIAGVVFLSEPLDWRLVAGGLLVLGGVAAVNWRPRRLKVKEMADS
jgi:drug/metabolite transporter (DMT)-like permease